MTKFVIAALIYLIGVMFPLAFEACIPERSEPKEVNKLDMSRIGGFLSLKMEEETVNCAGEGAQSIIRSSIFHGFSVSI